MVNFLDIEMEGDYIYATAEDVDNNIKVKVKMHKTKEEYATEDGRVYLRIQKAIWGLQSRLEKKKRLDKNETIAWY